MKKKIIYILLSAILGSVVLSSCASILGNGSQDVTILSKDPTATVTIQDSVYGKSSEIPVEFRKNWGCFSVKAEKPGCVTRSNVLVLNHTNPLTYVSFAFLLLPGGIDMMNPKGHYYESEILLEKPVLIPVHTESLKTVRLKKVGLYRNTENFLKYSFKVYNGDLYNYDIFNTISGGENFLFDKDAAGEIANNLLKRVGFTDTLHQIMEDNLNSTGLELKIKKVTAIDFIQPYIDWMHIGRISLTAEWVLLSKYSDTLIRQEISTISDLTVEKPGDNILYNSMKNVVELSLVQFLSDEKVKSVLSAEKIPVAINNKLAIKKPRKNPSSIGEALDATVIIKNESGHGSGFFISNDGYIVTNHHVVKEMKDIAVVTRSGREFKASLVKSDPKFDLALIKIDTVNESAFAVNKTDNFEPGEDILVAGAPKSLKLKNTLSKGIISSYRKYKETGYLQFDAPVNSGNSGGPVFGTDFSLKGVVDFKLFGVSAEMLAFAIPVNDIFESLSITFE